MSKINQIHISEHPYLQSMTGIDGLPKTLHCIGQLPSTRPPSVAIVGSRKPTSYGREVTHEIAYRLAKHGVTIISGLALGVDSIAHQAAIDAGGVTIAVQANGLHRIYPYTHQQLANEIVNSGGAIVSEYDVGIEPMQHRFLERNRLVSALADVVVVTEAAGRSGTLNTAAHAIEQGREVYAAPGNITSAMSAGCNRLIAQGAHPLLSVDQFISELLPGNSQAVQQILPLGRTELETAIITALNEGVRDGQALLKRSGATVTEFNTTITMLEIDGTIKPLGNNRWTLS